MSGSGDLIVDKLLCKNMPKWMLIKQKYQVIFHNKNQAVLPQVFLVRLNLLRKNDTKCCHLFLLNDKL